MTGNNELEQLRLYKALAEEHGLSVFEDMATLKRKGDLHQQAYNEVYDQLQEVKNQREVLLAALEDCLILIEALMPGVRHIALQDYAALNNTPMKARAAIASVKGGAS